MSTPRKGLVSLKTTVKPKKNIKKLPSKTVGQTKEKKVIKPKKDCCGNCDNEFTPERLSEYLYLISNDLDKLQVGHNRVTITLHFLLQKMVDNKLLSSIDYDNIKKDSDKYFESLMSSEEVIH